MTAINTVMYSANPVNVPEMKVHSFDGSFTCSDIDNVRSNTTPRFLIAEDGLMTLLPMVMVISFTDSYLQ